MKRILHIFLLLLIIVTSSNLKEVNAHSVQVAYCMDANGNLQLFVEHWHGTEDPNSTTMTISFIENGVTTTTTGSPQGSFINVPIGSLPGCASAITPFGSCAGSANTYNDWVQYSFPAVPCGVNIELVVQAGNTVFTEDCGGMFPATTGIITLPCPLNPITVDDQVVCSGTPFAAVNFPPQGVVYSWTNDNLAIGLPANGTGDIPAFTTPIGVNQIVANITVSYDGLTTIFSYTALGSPIANFTYAPFCEDVAGVFTESSTNSTPPINSWIWNFGDGSPNHNGQNPPNHQFPGTGPYNVTLTVTNGVCTDDIVVVVSPDPLPVPSFTTVPICEGTVTNFTNTSLIPTGTITGWEWDFTTNGSTDNTNINPTHGYPQYGTYNATLTATSNAGCVATVSNPVVVNPVPVSSFNFVEACENFAATFSSTSNVATGVINNYAWDFGDGIGNSTLENPNYTYTNHGTYTVLLTVTSDQGCINNSQQDIEIFSTPVSDFSFTDYCIGYGIDFNDNSTNISSAITQWDWDLGDASAIQTTEDIIDYIYAGMGPYDITLTVTSVNGCVHSSTQQVQANPEPIANFTSSFECHNDATVFTDLSTIVGGNIVSYNWDFNNDQLYDANVQNPSFTFANPGTFPIKLEVTSDLGCVDSITIDAVVHPNPVANFLSSSACDYETTQFTNQSNIITGNIVDYAWDFGDGAGTSVLANPGYNYSVANTYNATLTVTSNFGCEHSVTNPVTVYPKPIADFTFSDECLGTPIPLTSTSDGLGTNIMTTQWDYDGNTIVDDLGTSVNHSYGSYGFYNPVMIITTEFNCKDTATHQVEVFEIPVPNFTWVNACEHDAVNFTNTSFVNTGNITNFDWDFANGNISIQEDPSEIYVAEGIYNVSLTITSNNGCPAIINHNIEVYPTPSAYFIVPDVCDGTVSTFNELSTVSNANTNNNIISWNWTLNPGVPFNGQNPTYLYNAPGTYPISLAVTTNRGCTNDTTLSTTINPNPELDFSSPNPDGCTEWCADVVNNSTIVSGSLDSFIWENSDGQSSIDINPQFCFINNSLINESHDLQLTAISNFGCSTTENIADFFTIYPTPLANFEPSTYLTDIYRTEIDFTNTSLIAQTYEWNIANLETSTETDVTYTFSDLDSGTYEICLDVISMYGCVHDTCKTIFIQGYSNLYVPNAFTPDNDGKNDVFAPSVYGLDDTEYQFMIFDRWGALIYQTDNLYGSWDGTYLSEPCVQDVYVWKLKARDKYNRDFIELTGHLTLIR